jgi:hypothetical protein
MSSVPAGTVLKGLNFYKDKQDPVALADEEYPAWLWRVLDKTSGEVGGVKVDEGDLYGMLSVSWFCCGSGVLGFGVLRFGEEEEEQIIDFRDFFTDYFQQRNRRNSANAPPKPCASARS